MQFPKKDIGIVILWIVSTFFLLKTFPILVNFFQPMIIGGIIALIVYPMVKFLENKLKIVKKVGVTIVAIFIIFIVITICYFVFGFLIREISALIADIPSMYKSFKDLIDSFYDYLHNLETGIPAINNYIQGIGKWEINLPSSNEFMNYVRDITNSLLASVKGLPDLIINFIFVCLFAVIFTLNGSQIKAVIKEKLKLSKDNNNLVLIFTKLKDILWGYITAQLKLLVITFIIVFIGFKIINIEYLFLMSLLVALLDMLPFFGTGTILGPYAVISFIYGEWTIGIGCIIIYLVTFVVRRAIEPKLVGDSVGVSPLFSIFCMFVGYKSVGVLGLIFGIPVGVVILYLYKLNFFKSLTTSFENIFKYIKQLIFV